MSNIFRRVLLREMAHQALLVFTVLVMITVTTMLIRFLGQAASGSLANDAVLAFLLFSVVNYLPILLSLTLFIAVLLSLTRSYRDSEMVVWFSSGQSLTAWIRPVAYFALPVVALVALLSLVVTPWALAKSEEFRRQVNSRDDTSSIAPGVFKESGHAERVYFVESFAGEKNTVSNIFVRAIQHQKLGIVTAQQGYQTTVENGDRFLVLLNGRRYEGTPGQPDYKMVAFEKYAVRVDPYEARMNAPTVKSMDTAALLRDPNPQNMSEFLWRIGLPLSALILAILAIPLSFVNPRAGRSLNLILAILIYMIYNNSLSITQAWVAQGRMSAVVGIPLVHGVMLAVLAFYFRRRLSVGKPLAARIGDLYYKVRGA
ncbi:MAG: LPS export ABC transporter permease LptF [Sulfuricella sp.]|nr:LPS export ABC transporter permease LptF [Sulfuricella sp.]